MILRDTEDGEVLYTVAYENRRDSKGRKLGPKPRDDRSYDEKLIAPKDDESLIDIAGSLIDGP
jgi:hypothetical protein